MIDAAGRAKLEGVNAKLKTIEARLMAWHRQDQTSRLPGDHPRHRADRRGQLCAEGARGPEERFAPARHFAAWIGHHAARGELEPGANRGPAGSAGRATRTCAGSSCSAPPRWIQQAPRPGRASPWLLGLLERRPRKLAAVALANKMARTLWAMMANGRLTGGRRSRLTVRRARRNRGKSRRWQPVEPTDGIPRLLQRLPKAASVFGARRRNPSGPAVIGRAQRPDI